MKSNLKFSKNSIKKHGLPPPYGLNLSPRHDSRSRAASNMNNIAYLESIFKADTLVPKNIVESDVMIQTVAM